MLPTVNGSAALARKSEDRREVAGRALFAKGDCQGALEIFATLLAAKSDPASIPPLAAAPLVARGWRARPRT
jgi:hypothetical protein